jgi:hypothetical protein
MTLEMILSIVKIEMLAFEWCVVWSN